jgi:hypothetical protein
LDNGVEQKLPVYRRAADHFSRRWWSWRSALKPIAYGLARSAVSASKFTKQAFLFHLAPAYAQADAFAVAPQR